MGPQELDNQGHLIGIGQDFVFGPFSEADILP